MTEPIETPIETPTEPVEPVEPTEPTEPVEPEDKPIDVTTLEPETRGKKDREPIDYGDDIDPQDAATIGKIVEKQREQDRAELQTVKDEIEVNGFLQGKPEYTKYKDAILKYMQHPAYNNIPVKNIAAIVRSNDPKFEKSLLREGAKKEREAQATADATKTKGNAPRKPAGQSTDWGNAPVADVEEQIRKVRSGQA